MKEEVKGTGFSEGKMADCANILKGPSTEQLHKNGTQELVLGVKDSRQWNKNDKWAG